MPTGIGVSKKWDFEVDFMAVVPGTASIAARTFWSYYK
jgi:hypothetical protein